MNRSLFEKSLSFLILLILGLLLIGCGGRNSQGGNASGVTVSADPMSTIVGETMLMVNLTNSAGAPVTDAEITVKGDMTHAGMTPVLADPVRYDDGTGAYPVPFEWTMSGDWFLTIDVTLADGTTFTERVENIEIGEGDGEMEMDHNSDE